MLPQILYGTHIRDHVVQSFTHGTYVAVKVDVTKIAACFVCHFTAPLVNNLPTLLYIYGNAILAF